ncbi:hypothetical protein J6590_060588 [Homalodisca vitripennis]|nr:hypothetical protein J6590_060588 [Homalodisca vitripennis]
MSATTKPSGPPVGPARHGLGAGVRGRTTAHRIVYRLSVVQPLAGVGQYATAVCFVYNSVCCVCTMSTMDHSIPGLSGNASEATRIELQPENLDNVNVDDPVQRAVDDVSDEESDDGSSVNDTDEDPNYSSTMDNNNFRNETYTIY